MFTRRFISLLTLAILVAPGSAIAQTGEQGLLTALDSLLDIPIDAAAKYTQRRADVASSVTIVTAEEIERHGYRTLDDVFENVRGFYVSNDRNYSYLGARGFSRPTDYNNRILLLIDGHTENDNLYGASLFGTAFGFDLRAVDRIEIIRGPGSALYGTGAMFAVVNVVTKSAADIDGLEFSGEVGNYGEKGGSVLAGTTFGSGLEIVASGRWSDLDGEDLFFPDFDDPTTNNGMANNLDWDRVYAGHVSLRYQGLTLRAVHSSQDKGIPTAPWEMNFNDPAAETHDEFSFVELKYEQALSPSTALTVRGHGNRNQYDGGYPYDPTWFDYSLGEWIGSELRFRWDLSSNHRLGAGAEAMRSFTTTYRSWDEDDEYFGGDFNYSTYSLFVQDELQVSEQLALTGGLRFDHRSTVGGGATPRVAVLYHPSTSSTVKLLYGEAFRHPSVWELWYEEGSDGIIANPALGAEKIRTAEVVIEQRLSRGLYGSVSLYRYDMRGLIDYTEIASPDTVEFGEIALQYNNIADVRALGAELEMTAVLGSGVMAYGSYTFQHAEDTELDSQLSNSPSHLVKFGFTGPVGRYVNFGSNFVYESARKTLQDTETDPFFLVDLTLSTNPIVRGLSLSATVTNLFDTEYRVPGGWEHAQDAIVQYGRRFRVGLRYKL
jgi:iron complex outermembrane receptor protein